MTAPGALVLALMLGTPPGLAPADLDPSDFAGFTGATRQAGGSVEVGATRADEAEAGGAAWRPVRSAFVTTYEHGPRCGNDGPVRFAGTVACSPVVCRLSDGRSGTLSMLFRYRTERATGHTEGPFILDDVCRADADAVRPDLHDLVEREFRSMKLPGTRVRTRPADMTLVHWPTRFAAERPWSRRSLGRILGHRVTVEIDPVRYEWAFGDGRSLQTGPRRWVRHAYDGPGEMHASVTTTYRARYRVDGGNPRRISGTVRVAGPATPVAVRSARAQLVAGPEEASW